MKKIATLLVMAGLFSATPALAHTGLETSTPADGETITEPVDEITLEFNTVVEESSTVKVSTEEGVSVKTGEIMITESSLTATFAEPLPNGSYSVTWDIIGEDGHEIQDVFSFTVNAEGNEVAGTESGTAVEEPVFEEEDMSESGSEPVPSSTTNTIIMPIAMGVLTLVAIGATIFFLRRKKQ